MKKIIIFILLIASVYCAYNYIKEKKAGNKKLQIIVETYTYNNQSVDEIQSQQLFPAEVGLVLPVGDNAKISKVTDDFITISFEKVMISELSHFRSDYCLSGSEELVRLNRYGQIRLSDCNPNGGTAYIIRYQ